MSSLILIGTGSLFLALAACFDVRQRRIPNRLVLPGMLAGVVLNAGLPAGIGFVSSVEGWGLGLALSLPLFILRAMGAGDAKLIAMVGAFLGPLHLLGALLSIGLAGGVLAIGVAWHTGTLRRVLENVRSLLFGMFFKAAIGNLPTLDPLPEPAAKLPYGVAIALGTFAYLLWLNFVGGRS